jgi:hypothetical protein
MQRRVLRACAQAALQRLKFQVEVRKRPRVVPGGRLTVRRGPEKLQVAVRTSSKRDVTLLRGDDGKWKTIPGVDLVVVAVPTEHSQESVDVFGFDPPSMLELFDRAAAFQRKRNPAVSEELPICVALDSGRSKGFGKAISGLKDKAKWSETVAIDDSILASAKKLEGVKKGDSTIGFVERVKRELAELMGVDVSKVEVTFRILD